LSDVISFLLSFSVHIHQELAGVLYVLEARFTDAELCPASISPPWAASFCCFSMPNHANISPPVTVEEFNVAKIWGESVPLNPNCSRVVEQESLAHLVSPSLVIWFSTSTAPPGLMGLKLG
jgi:hypothetical protein